MTGKAAGRGFLATVLGQQATLGGGEGQGGGRLRDLGQPPAQVQGY